MCGDRRVRRGASLIKSSEWLRCISLSGLGFATTQHLLRLGAHVAVIDLYETGREKFDQSTKVRIFQANVALTEEVSAAVMKIIEWSEFGKLEIGAVICCAGLLGPAGKSLIPSASGRRLLTITDFV